MRLDFHHEKINWDFSPSDIQRFLGGTEAWLVELASALQRRGHEVSVRGDFGSGLEYDRVEYVDRKSRPDGPPADAEIFWNHPSAAIGAEISSAKRFYWSNGVEPWAPDYKEFYDSLDAYVPMSRQQLEETQAPVKHKSVVIPGGINPKEFENLGVIERKVGQCIYTSSWDRGLECILASWPYIKKKAPSLSLIVTYGGGGKWQDPSKVPLMPELEDVRYVGALQKDQKNVLTRSSDWLLYANREPRSMKRGIYLSAIEAQYAGCVGVTTPHVAADSDVYSGIQVQYKEWPDTLIALANNKELSGMARERLKETKVPTWDDVAAKWESLIASKL